MLSFQRHFRIVAVALMGVVIGMMVACDTKKKSASNGDPPISAAQRFRDIVTAAASQTPAETAAAVQALVDDVKDTGPSFPLLDGDFVIFIHHDDGNAGPFHVAGTFNSWSTSADAMAELNASGWWWAEINLGNDKWAEYKFVRQAVEWRADPLNRRFSYEFGNSVINRPGSTQSHLERWRDVAATQLGNTRDVIVYLPAGYDPVGATRYPVIYAHDGQNMFDPTAIWGGWELDSTLDAKIAGNEMRPVIVVAVANTPGRMDEYTHTPDDISGSCSGPIIGGDSDKYGHFLFVELKPMIDATYRTLTDRDHTALLGSSLGGLVSVTLAYDHPTVVRRLAAMSSTFGWGSFCLGNPTAIDIVTAAGKHDFIIYIDSGGAGAGNPSQDNYGVTRDMETLLISQGFEYDIDLKHWWEPNALHNEQAWAARVHQALIFLFPPN